MSLALSPAILEAAYDFLRTTPPFKSWKLPPAEEIRFRVMSAKDCRGWHTFNNGEHDIAISRSVIGRTSALMETLAHEMIHVYQINKKSWTKNTEHNAEFWRLAKIICKHHGFDPKLF